MKQSLQLRIGQHLAMTPQLQQAIRLLQLSSLELQAEIQEALDSNMMLELSEDGDDGDFDSGREGGDGVAEVMAEPAVEPVDIPGELAVDSAWDDIYESAAPAGGGGDGNGLDGEIHHGADETLHDFLNWQLELTPLSDVDRALATVVVDAIDEDGYLTQTLEELCESLNYQEQQVEVDEMEAVLHRVQQFDPPGVGARDLRECLLLQLQALSLDTAWREQALALVAAHLELLAARDYPQLLRLLSLDKDELQHVIGLIQSLSPRPGARKHSAPAQYVVPDVFVRKVRGTWQVELNVDAFPRLRVNTQYASFIRRADNSADNSTMRSQLQEARWFIKSLKSRSETLLKVARCIVERQGEFLEHGDEAMRPMVLHDVAETVGMHESTISRVTTQKYMHTPRGIYELKYFFSSHLSTKSGGEASSTAIRAVLKKLIAAENPRIPLSDSKLAEILSEQGINVARRTVAKYRESMAIPSSGERKCLV